MKTLSLPKTVTALSTSSILPTKVRFSLCARVVYRVTLVCVIFSFNALYSLPRLFLISSISYYCNLIVPYGLLFNSIYCINFFFSYSASFLYFTRQFGKCPLLTTSLYFFKSCSISSCSFWVWNFLSTILTSLIFRFMQYFGSFSIRCYALYWSSF